MLEAGHHINARDSGGHTPLYHSAWQKHAKVCQLLLGLGADKELGSLSEDTPLHIAAWVGSDLVCQILVDNGARMDVRDIAGRTPLNIAKSQGHEEVVRILASVKPSA